MKLFVFLAFLLGSSAAVGQSVAPDECATVQSCIERISTLDDPSPGLSRAEQALVLRLSQFGDSAVPDLVDMLADQNEYAASIAAAALGDVESIDPQFLPEIVAGLGRGLGWLPRALGRIDSDEAAQEAVRRYLVSRSAPYNQEAVAIRLLGSRAIPYILEAARCPPGDCDERYFYLLGFVLGEMGPERAAAADGLFTIARDSVTDNLAEGALIMISMLGEQGRLLEDRLLELRQARPELSPAVADALIGIRSAYSANEFVDRLANETDTFENRLTLRDLAEVGTVAASAGPTVVGRLESPEPDIRLAAARTLGFIGYGDAAAPLTALLDDPMDVRLNWAAAESLGRLRASSAREALLSTAEDHWYPPVRETANKAVRNIESWLEYSDTGR
jgi:HEAT repeat protein